jgi:hypothetical protein
MAVLRPMLHITPTKDRREELSQRGNYFVKASVPINVTGPSDSNARNALSYLSLVLQSVGSRDSSVSIVSGYGLDKGAFEVRSPTETKRIFPAVCVSRQALEPNQPPVQWVPGSFPRRQSADGA